MVAVCEDEASHNLLVEVAPSFEITGGVRFKTVSMDELMEYRRVAAWIPGQPVETELILKRL